MKESNRLTIKSFRNTFSGCPSTECSWTCDGAGIIWTCPKDNSDEICTKKPEDMLLGHILTLDQEETSDCKVIEIKDYKGNLNVKNQDGMWPVEIRYFKKGFTPVLYHEVVASASTDTKTEDSKKTVTLEQLEKNDI